MPFQCHSDASLACWALFLFLSFLPFSFFLPLSFFIFPFSFSDRRLFVTNATPFLGRGGRGPIYAHVYNYDLWKRKSGSDMFTSATNSRFDLIFWSLKREKSITNILEALQKILHVECLLETWPSHYLPALRHPHSKKRNHGSTTIAEYWIALQFSFNMNWLTRFGYCVIHPSSLYAAVVAGDTARNFSKFLALTIGFWNAFSSQALANHVLKCYKGEKNVWAFAWLYD